MPSGFRLPPGALFYLHRQSLLDALQRVRGFVRNRVLDVGCLDKPYEQRFRGQVTSWIGVDMPAHGGQASRADVFGRIEALPFQAGAFDTVFCTETLYMVAEPGRAFTEMRRLLAPSGHLLVTANQYAIENPNPPDYYRFTRFGLKHLAQAAGLEVVALEPVGGAIATLGFALLGHLGPLRGERPLARAARMAFERAALAADRHWPEPRDALGWILVARR